MATAHPAESTDIEVHRTNYHLFTLSVKWFAIHCAALVAFLTLWFATRAGFLPALIVGVILFAGGVWAMTHGMAHSSETSH